MGTSMSENASVVRTPFDLFHIKINEGTKKYGVISTTCRIKLSFFSAMGYHTELRFGLYQR